MAEKELNARQRRFVEEYLVDLKATHAAIRAGYSERTAYSQGQRLLKKVEVLRELAAAQKERAERTEVTQDWVIHRLQIEAHGMGPDTTASARIRASELLGKHLGMFVNRVEHSGPDGGPIEVHDTLREKIMGMAGLTDGEEE